MVTNTKSLVGGQGAKPPEAKSIFIFWMSCGSGKSMALGAMCPPRGSANACCNKEAVTFWMNMFQVKTEDEYVINTIIIFLLMLCVIFNLEMLMPSL